MVRISERERYYLSKVVEWGIPAMAPKPGMIEWLERINERKEAFDPGEEDLHIGTFKSDFLDNFQFYFLRGS